MLSIYEITRFTILQELVKIIEYIRNLEYNLNVVLYIIDFKTTPPV